MDRKSGDEEDEVWRREIATKVLRIVSSWLPQRELVSILLVSRWLDHALTSCPSIWQVIDLHEMNMAGNRLAAALSLRRYEQVRQIKLEFAQDVEDSHFELLKIKCSSRLQRLEVLNLNGCQKISDKGIESITLICPNLKVFSVYWNVRVTDAGTQHLVKNCRHVIDLNLSGCKNISDKTMQLVADNYQQLKSLNITRCTKVSDDGLRQVLQKCSSLQYLNLYALSSLTDMVYHKISLLTHLRCLDLCGAQNLSDMGLKCIAECRNLESLNLTWCICITDVGVKAIALNCSSLELLSLFGIVGITDSSIEALSQSCGSTLKTLDVNGCINVKRRSREELLQLFPYLQCFKVHS